MISTTSPLLVAAAVVGLLLAAVFAWTMRGAGRRSTGAPSGTEPPAGELDPEVLALLRDGQKIAAIKLQRERTGQGLKEAKEAVEAFE